jgi:hypothetical protein
MVEFELDGIWSAETAEAAEEVVEGEGCMDCERVFDMPDVGSDLDIGQRYLTRGFREGSTLILDWTGEGLDDEAVTVVVLEEVVEAREVDELDRVAVFREGINILWTSSALME